MTPRDQAEPAACAKCRNDPQPENFGSPRRCAFDADGMFTPDNWNCATLNALLDAADVDEDTIEGFDESLNVVPARKDRDYGGWIVLTRYKHRGKTSSAVHVGDFWPCRALTLRQALIALGEVNPDDDE